MKYNSTVTILIELCSQIARHRITPVFTKIFNDTFSISINIVSNEESTQAAYLAQTLLSIKKSSLTRCKFEKKKLL